MTASPLRVRLIRTALGVLAVAQASALALHATGAVVLAPRAAGSVSAASAETSEVPPASSTSSTASGESPPAVEPTITGTEGNGGWYTSDVSLTWTTSDDETPITSTEGCDAASVTADTTGDTFACTATSDGGTRTTTVVIARDATAPTDVAVTASPAANENGWHTAPFTATWTGTDATSGIAACSSASYSGPDTTAGSLSGTCTDAAGNAAASSSYDFRYDATAPGVTGTADRAPDSGTWYNAPLTVTWSSDDAGAVCDDPTPYSGPDAAAASVTGGCTDEAGNRAETTVTFDYDATAPVIVLTTPMDGGSYVLNQPVAADYSCSDATSGVAACTGTAAAGADIDTASVGPKSFAVDGTDAAGNQARVEHAYAVTYAPVGQDCGGVRGHEILQPVRTDGSSRFQQGSTVPAKFRVCDYYGDPVTTPDVVSSFRLIGVGEEVVDRAVPSTSAHDSYRASEGQWIYNVSTKGFAVDLLHTFRIALGDGTWIDFAFTPVRGPKR